MSSQPVSASTFGFRLATVERDAGRSTKSADRERGVSTSSEAIAGVYSRCGDVLYRFFMVRLGGDRAETDDLMQRLWIAAQRGAGGVPEAELEFWLRGVAKRLVVERVREVGRERRNLPRASAEVAGELAERIGRERLPAEMLARREVMDQLLLAVTELGSADFEAVHLHYFVGLGLAEIGTRLGLSERAVEGRMYRARAELRERLRRIAE